MTQIPAAYRRAFERWGYLADAEARKLGLPNGATLLAKIGYVETHYSSNLGITSSAGARGPMQFMPETRQAYIDRYHVDPWASVDEAVHAAAIFMKTSGLSGYNPGSSSYISEVLHAPVSLGRGRGPQGRPNVRQTPASTSTSEDGAQGDTLVRFLLSTVLVLGGVGLAGVGVSRAVGSSPLDAVSQRIKGGGEVE